MKRSWVDPETWARFRRHSHQGRLYLNYGGQDNDSASLTKDAPELIDGRLAAIKQRYDPENMFRFNQTLQPRTAGATA